MEFSPLNSDLRVESDRLAKQVERLTRTFLNSEKVKTMEPTLLFEIEAGLSETSSSCRRISELSLRMEDLQSELDLIPLHPILQTLETGLRNFALSREKLISTTEYFDDSISISRKVWQQTAKRLEDFLKLALEFGIEPASERQLRNKPKACTFQISTRYATGDAAEEQSFLNGPLRNPRGTALDFSWDGNGLCPPQFEEFARELGRHRVQVSFDGVPSEKSTLRLIYPNQNLSRRSVEIHGIDGVIFCLPLASLRGIRQGEGENVESLIRGSFVKLDAEMKMRPSVKSEAPLWIEVCSGARSRWIGAQKYRVVSRTLPKSFPTEISANLSQSDAISHLILWEENGDIFVRPEVNPDHIVFSEVTYPHE